MQVKETRIKRYTIEALSGKNWEPVMDMAISAIKDFKWQLGFGTLLGIVREKNIIQHDIDIDIDILIKKSTSAIQEELNKIQSRLDAQGFSFMKKQEYDHKLMSLAVLHNATKIIIDYCIFYGEWGDDYLHIGTEGIVIRPKNSITTTKKMGYNIPKNYDSYLTGRYGDWRTPNKSKNNWSTDASKGNLFINLK